MITSVIVSNQQAGEPISTGYATLKEAIADLAEIWPMLVSEREQYAVLANKAGSMLLLEVKQNKRLDSGNHPALLFSAKFNPSTLSGRNEIIKAASGSTANSFWMDTGLRPCELIIHLAAEVTRLSSQQEGVS